MALTSFLASLRSVTNAQMYGGQAGRVQHAFKIYILDPVVKWRKEVGGGGGASTVSLQEDSPSVSADVICPRVLPSPSANLLVLSRGNFRRVPRALSLRPRMALRQTWAPL